MACGPDPKCLPLSPPQVGERLGRYDVEKRSALEKEDYELAQTRTEQMEEYRGRVYQQLQVHDLLDMAAMQTLVRPMHRPALHSPWGREADTGTLWGRPPEKINLFFFFFYKNTTD